MLKQHARIEGQAFQFHFPRFKFGEIKDVVNHAHKRFGGGTRRFHEIELLFVERSLGQQLHHAEDAVHRGADFVAHVCQKHGFGAAGFFRSVSGTSELAFTNHELIHQCVVFNHRKGLP